MFTTPTNEDGVAMIILGTPWEVLFLGFPEWDDTMLYTLKTTI